MMSRKHYVAVAAAIHDAYALQDAYGPGTNERAAARDAVRDVALNLADLFAADNPRFSRARFFEACGTDSLGDDVYVDETRAEARVSYGGSI